MASRKPTGAKTFETLKEWRESQGLSQEAAARRFGVSLNTYSRWERQRNLPRRDTAKQMSEDLGVSYAFLRGVA